MKKKIVSFLGVFLGLSVSGVILAVISAVGGVLIYQGQLFGFGGLAGLLAGMILGYPIGVIVGMVLFNRLWHYRGSLFFGVSGVLLGAVLVWVVAQWLHPGPSVIFGTYFGMSTLAGTVGFRLRRGRSED
ncbi:hypothetical protein ACFLV1_02800 [Chloroflexota bacterium]